ncbi:MAG TPA: hypothetical protein PKY30_16405 [Myxococcota bacterium]|nr:hypothetical protein [Myxococcota bacterium]
MKAQTGTSADAVNQSAQHILYVEGTADGIDVSVLKELVGPRLLVRPLGSCFSLRSVSAALHPHHPEWWFIIDRDHWNDEEVDKSWRNFPNPAEQNLLIWRRKELENYFLEPHWLSGTGWLKPGRTESDLQAWLCKKATAQLTVGAANRVLLTKREAVKGAKIPLFEPSDFSTCRTPADGAGILCNADQIRQLQDAGGVGLDAATLRREFEEEVLLLSGGEAQLAWNVGRWRELLPGKELFRDMVREFLNVRDLTGALQGQRAYRALGRTLLRDHPEAMPQDFRDLKQILDRFTNTPLRT